MSRPGGTPRRVPSFALKQLPTPAKDHTADSDQPTTGPSSSSTPGSDVSSSGSLSDEDGDDAGSEDGKEDPMEAAIDLIGMGPYQWKLLVLCGFGWLCDNMYLQCIAVILPRVQDHFDVPPGQIGTLTSATMLGMMIGAIVWGSAADLVGRKTPFRATLGLTAIFGLACSWSTSFGWLRLGLFCLGLNVGGSMPTDGTILLENLPRSKQYLLTFLSTFFSIGAILSSTLGLVILPNGSCPERLPGGEKDDGWCGNFEMENWGWRWMLRIQGCLTVVFFVGRLFLFRLHEAPRFLLSTGRTTEATSILRLIGRTNGVPLGRLERLCSLIENGSGWTGRKNSLERPRTPEREERGYEGTDRGVRRAQEGRPTFSFNTPTREESQRYLDQLRSSIDRPSATSVTSSSDSTLHPPPPSRPQTEETADGPASRRGPTRLASYSPLRPLSPLPPKGFLLRMGQSAREARAKLGEIFEPDWRRTTILIWIVWGCLAMGYTMFNAFLPTILEDRIGAGQGGGSADGDGKSGRQEALEEYLAYTCAGLPGSMLGAWLVETSFGRRQTLALSTLVTALAMFLFSAVSTKTGVVGSSMAISLASTAMYAVLYGMTPEIFSTEIRGTACGSAAAVSRLTGIVAPLATGTLLTIGPSLPLWTAAGFFVVSTGATWLLPFERAEDAGKGGKGDYAVVGEV